MSIAVASSGAKSVRLVLYALLAAALLIRLLFWLYTGRTWEDALITVLHAENLWQNGQLSHLRLDGGPVHGFTSPISVIVPIIGGAIDLQGTLALPFIKLISALCAPLTIWLAWLVIRTCTSDTKEQRTWLIFSLSYLAFEHHQILWGMAGMETQMVVASIFFAFWACANPTALRLGAAMAAALYARPDFVFLDVAVCAYVFMFVGRTTMLRAIAIGAALYLPWIAFTTLYYGSPIPNTILAKLHGYAEGPGTWLTQLLSLWIPLGPSYAGNGSGYYPIFDGGTIGFLVAALFALGVFFSIRQRVRMLYVPIAFVVIYTFYFVFVVEGVFGWYVVPLSAATVFVAGFGAVQLAQRGGTKADLIGLTFASAYAFSILSVAHLTARGERHVQRFIEDPVRRSLGLYLGQIMKPSERIGLEPLGYVAYYSRRSVLDYPGLVNPEVVALTGARGPVGLCSMLNEFRPEYVALRHYECQQDGWLAERYRKIEDFTASSHVKDMLMVDKNIDLHFKLYQRTDLAPPTIDRRGQPVKLRTLNFAQANLTDLGPALDVGSVTLSEAFASEGWAPTPAGPGTPPTGPAGWASYARLGDAGQGEMSAEVTVPEGIRAVAVPVVTGPNGVSTRFWIMDAAGREIAKLDAPDIPEWRLWLVELPPGIFTVHVADYGKEWGEWAGVGNPHAVKSAISPQGR